jgi:hypothetical protein
VSWIRSPARQSDCAWRRRAHWRGIRPAGQCGSFADHARLWSRVANGVRQRITSSAQSVRPSACRSGLKVLAPSPNGSTWNISVTGLEHGAAAPPRVRTKILSGRSASQPHSRPPRRDDPSEALAWEFSSNRIPPVPLNALARRWPAAGAGVRPRLGGSAASSTHRARCRHGTVIPMRL